MAQPPARLETIRHTLESTFGDAQDFEFTVENGKLWLLQTRTAKRTPWAALQIACDLVNEGVIDPPTALDRLRPYNLDQITALDSPLSPAPHRSGALPRPTPEWPPAASPSTPTPLDSTPKRARQSSSCANRPPPTTSPSWPPAAASSPPPAPGTCHAAVVARQLGIVCLVSCPDLHIDTHARWLSIGDHRLNEDDTVTIDGATGNIYSGALEVVEDHPHELIDRVRTWHQDGARDGRRRVAGP